MFLADVKAVRKHTSKVWRDIKSILNYQLDGIQEDFQQIENDAMDMQNSYLTAEEVRTIVWDLWTSQKVLTGQQMNILKKEMFHSENFKMYNHKDTDAINQSANAWNLYNNITESLKVSHPTKYFKDHEKVHALMMEYVN